MQAQAQHQPSLEQVYHSRSSLPENLRVVIDRLFNGVLEVSKMQGGLPANWLILKSDLLSFIRLKHAINRFIIEQYVNNATTHSSINTGKLHDLGYAFSIYNEYANIAISSYEGLVDELLLNIVDRPEAQQMIKPILEAKSENEAWMELRNLNERLNSESSVIIDDNFEDSVAKFLIAYVHYILVLNHTILLTVDSAVLEGTWFRDCALEQTVLYEKANGFDYESVRSQTIQTDFDKSDQVLIEQHELADAGFEEWLNHLSNLEHANSKG